MKYQIIFCNTQTERSNKETSQTETKKKGNINQNKKSMQQNKALNTNK